MLTLFLTMYRNVHYHLTVSHNYFILSGNFRVSWGEDLEYCPEDIP